VRRTLEYLEDKPHKPDERDFMKNVTEESIETGTGGRRALKWTAFFTFILSSLSAVFVWLRRSRKNTEE
jgi:hypothetical protein